MEAALDAGFSESMAKAAAARIETPEVQKAFRQLVRKAIPEHRIIERLSEGLDAEHKTPVISGKEVIDWNVEPDYRERREYLELAAKFGAYYIERKEIHGDIEFTVSDRRTRVAETLSRLAGETE